MVVPMIKYSLLVFHADYERFLKDLKKLGLLHIEVKKQELTPRVQDLYREHLAVSRTIRLLTNRVVGNEAGVSISQFTSGEEVYERVKAIEGILEQKGQELANLEKEAQQIAPWGNFSPPRIKKLRESGISIRFFTCRENDYDENWEKDYFISYISSSKGYRYFVLVTTGQDQVTPFADIQGVDEIQLPAKSLGAIREEQLSNKDDIRSLNLELDSIASNCVGLLKQYALDIQATIDDGNAVHQTTALVDDKVMMIEGYVPGPRTVELENFCNENSIVFISRAPLDNEKVPVLLKNNRFARLFEVIGGLYELPNHRELDLVPFFAPFYMMFFGFAMGDAGYGLFILLVTVLLKSRIKDVKTRAILSLAQWLGASTVVFGALTGTFFGINLLQQDIAWLEGIKQYMIDTDRMFTLALILGVIQILFGMVLKVINVSITKGFSYAWSTIGWLFLICGGGASYALGQAGVVGESTQKTMFNIVLIISATMILLLNNPRRNLAVNFLAGLWDVYSMTTGLVGDLLSYIRLFALGVSSAILGFVFNELAMSLSPDHIIFGPLVMIIILVIGHGMTLFMSGLGAFVHPIRLTFVEFYKNAGFTGGGKRYMPFADNNPQ